jgi:hypothetical protein
MSLCVAYAEQHPSVILMTLSHIRHDLEQSSDDLSESAAKSHEHQLRRGRNTC